MTSFQELADQTETAMEMRPAAMDGRMISSGEADPRSLSLMTVMGISWIMDMLRARNMHMALLARGE